MKRNIGAILFSVILISVITFPFLWLLLGSFKTMKELFSVPIRFFPEHISLDNYIAVFKAQPFGLYLFYAPYLLLLPRLWQAIRWREFLSKAKNWY